MVNEFAGGALIGLAAGLLWLGIGRISGMTGVLSSLFLLRETQRHWAIFFLLGLVLAYPLFQLFGLAAPIHITSNVPLLIVAGLFVGFGTYVGNGCTSGHGVCGMGRLSVRSTIATVVFMVSGIITVWLMRVLGGDL
ncbi:MAG: YeeE/YedE family protein [Thalassolituus sp.]|jgi:uncharacterized membrane protein YedE/YeeE|uniref:Sulphur transport domain-containing protein n=2 Tax=root TaxID=1 RepID=M5DVZ0_9GAMM|nr:hypothetical protein [Thalassolituus oleivorans]PCI49481.1 MAG: hypothetical protein COB43_05175 [Oceanospirillales bacterium]AHK16748.1 YeeE/YedE family protein [Thalassolituus oleivorans R6-15]APR68283.1 hypothetical protein CN03_15850 [Thalassolituus oleivorans]MCA6126477.1 membrane protein [Thalassolituus oleivorans 4BN06-13]CCU73567.1 hypothetical protein TOL_3171 [Thalassolituus oleivorans MIL-1]|tara:strand:- start:530 stop:940 length:411 start_codon:yes stop_codon:yes gene_type:complete